MRRGATLFGVVFALMFVGIIAYNVMVFQDCRKHGYAMFQCNAAMSNPHYIAIDQMKPQNDGSNRESY